MSDIGLTRTRLACFLNLPILLVVLVVLHVLWSAGPGPELWALTLKVTCMMENSCSFATPGSSASGSHEQRNEKSVEGKNKCTACGMPVTGHLGLCGSAKCLYSLLSKVTSRVDELEQAGRARQEELESLQSLNSERQVALLETILFQEERIEKLEDELKILKRGKKEEGVIPPLPEEQPDHENVQSVSPAHSTASSSSTGAPKSIAERKPAAGQDEGSSPSSQPTQACSFDFKSIFVYF